ncbi:MAG: family 43 glycosylhydrolase [Firmicutes bacterium]|nr:family 43 glycosylhydrolase [Bacillota bacterium]
MKHLLKKHNILINCILIVIFLSVIISTTVFAQADNPILKNVRTADPNPLVYNGRFYIVCGQDEVNTNAFNMYAWRLMSSADMNTWTDHGVIARPGDYSWMPSNRAWASSLVYRNGKFYFYIATDWAVGVLTATNITGPYTDPLGKALIDKNTPGHAARDIDPMCFIDSDGQAYLFWGGDGNCRYARLNSDMISLATGVMDVPGLTGSGYTYLEAPFVIKSGSTYFLMYADQPWPSKIRYATSSSINGPWTHRGVIGDPTGTGTNHSGAAYFNGQWWYTYHTEELSNGNPYSRCVCVDPMTISGDTINKISYSSFWMSGGGTYYKLRNRATNLCIDGMGRTSNGANAGQYASNSSYNQQWVLEAAGSYYKIKNRTTGLYLDGMGRTSNGSICGQWPSSTSYNQQWAWETVGSYYKFKNRATGLYLDGMGSTANGADLCQWASSSSYNQQWSIVAP